MVSRIQHQDEGITGAEEARSYAENHRKYAGLMYRPLLKHLGRLGISGRYLEIGSGPGFLAAMIAEKDPNVRITAIDISPDMVLLASGYMKERGVQDRVKCVLGDVGDRGFLESLGRFDLVYSAFSVHHWKDPERCLGNIWAATKDGGVVYLYDLNRVWWLGLLPFGGKEVERLRGAYSSLEMRSLIQKAGARDFTIRKHYAGLMQSALVREYTAVRGG
ncbi:MAG: class I SAM-dependent methyltransferase [Dehalococcoidia bacterium]|nr:class I SAM-dependent methyltransferase [Dehalococcoidia bacterium]